MTESLENKAYRIINDEFGGGVDNLRKIARENSAHRIAQFYQTMDSVAYDLNNTAKSTDTLNYFNGLIASEIMQMSKISAPEKNPSQGSIKR